MITPSAIVFLDLNDEFTICGEINDTNFAVFKEILAEVFCLKHDAAKEYNTQGELAKKIADKFKRRKQ